jgi:hypothetical protein
MEQKTIFNQINVEPLKLFRPVLSGLLLNAFYSLLLLKKTSGVEITQKIEEEAIEEIFDLYGRIDETITKIFEQPPPEKK